MTSTAITFRPFTDDELPTALALLGEVFHETFDDADTEAERSVHEPSRSMAAFDGEEMVGSLGCYSHAFSVPGGEVAGGGTTWVGVKPTHRRQGILRQMMLSHLQEVADHGDPIAALWASEAEIYGRFGYGLATEQLVTTLHSDAGLRWRPEVDVADVTLRSVSVEEAAPRLAPVYERARRQRAGVHARSDAWWRFQTLSTRPNVLNGGVKRVAVAIREGEDVGYAIYESKERWGDRGPDGTVSVVELVGVDGPAEVALWRYLAGIDLTTSVKAFRRPVDDPLVRAVADPRRVQRRVSDALHVRIIDVQAALQARSYATSAGVTLELVDPLFEENDGIWRLEVAPEGVHLSPTDDTPELSMGIRELGSLYLGADLAEPLARLGLIQVSNPDALTALSQAMRTPLAPWCPEVW